MIFPSAAKKSDWLHLVAASNPYGSGTDYNVLAAGNLWVVSASNLASTLPIARKLGGKEVAFQLAEDPAGALCHNAVAPGGA